MAVRGSLRLQARRGKDRDRQHELPEARRGSVSAAAPAPTKFKIAHSLSRALTGEGVSRFRKIAIFPLTFCHFISYCSICVCACNYHFISPLPGKGGMVMV